MQANRAPIDAPISTFLLTVGVLATPAAWLLQICAGEALVAHACFPHDVPLRIPIEPAVRWSVIAISGAMLVIGVLGTWLAWRNWRRLTQAKRRQRAQASEATERSNTTVEGEAFVARVGLMASALFLFALVATDVATGLISACF